MLTIIDDDQRHPVSGRLEEIMRILLENQRDITQPHKVSIRFDCAGKSIAPSIEKKLEVRPAR